MAVLASRVAAGGAVGDVIDNDVVVRVFADTKYGFVPKSGVGDLYDVVANVAARPAVATKSDGYQVKVTTNGLIYEVRDGVYAVSEYEFPVSDVAARDALTEKETGQRVYIDGLDRTDRWNGTAWVEGVVSEGLVNTYGDLIDPTTLRVGTKTRVVNDPNTALNGVHVVVGADVGGNGTYWDAA